MAFFFSVFLNSSQTASIIGYSLSIWIATFATTMNVSIYTWPARMSWWLYPFPTFPFCRIMYHMAMDCAYIGCTRSMFKMKDEAYYCVIAIYLEAVIYLVLALYLYQVIPQTYGVPKHPLYFLKKYVNKKSKLYSIIYGNPKDHSNIIVDLSEEER
jgi:hypothetical protein